MFRRELYGKQSSLLKNGFKEADEMKKTMLTWKTLDKFEEQVNIEDLSEEQIREAEQLAYCANMGAKSNADAWKRFRNLIAEFLKISMEG